MQFIAHHQFCGKPFTAPYAAATRRPYHGSGQVRSPPPAGICVAPEGHCAKVLGLRVVTQGSGFSGGGLFLFLPCLRMVRGALNQPRITVKSGPRPHNQPRIMETISAFDDETISALLFSTNPKIIIQVVGQYF
jgi:hypothetical protein